MHSNGALLRMATSRSSSLSSSFQPPALYFSAPFFRFGRLRHAWSTAGVFGAAVCCGLGLSACQSTPSQPRAKSGPDPVVISQKDKRFSQTRVEAIPGTPLVFVNDDTVKHNVYSSSAVQQFDFGEQLPGQTSTVTLTAPGDLVVRCAIHPQMVLKVHVKGQE